MKCKYLFLSISAFVLASCGMDRDAFNEQIYQESVKNNAAQKLGVTIDPNHTWSSVTKSSISITADAPLIDIQKVRILTESPFFNDNAEFLAEAEVSKGQTITLDYDAPKDLDRLIAACIDSKGNYYIKGFNPGEKSVSFAKSSRARTRGVAGVPDLSGVIFNLEESSPSYNAERTIKANKGEGYDGWKDSGWERDRLWHPAGTAGGWTIDHSTIFTSADAITDEEKEELLDIFNACLYRDDRQGYKGRRDNLPTIREGNAVKFFNNHLVTDGKNPITLIPVQLASTDAAICDIYYYYFKPEDIPSGVSEADYIKTLPKFKAIDLDVERNAFSAQTGIATNVRDENFLRVHEYLLPYYGDPSTFMQKETPLSTLGYNTDGKVYRIKNAEVGKCMTYTTNSEISMTDPYDKNAGNIKDQLWQIYRHNNGTIIFYNVGIGKFMKFITKAKPNFNIPASENDLDNYLYRTADKNNNETNATENIHIFFSTWSHVLKSDAKIRVATDANNKTDRATIQWTFEEYGPASTGEATVPFQSNPVINPSPIFAKGYRIGFMVRKNKNNSISESQNGCLYGYGELNRQINTFGQFKSAITDYSMKENDPRIAMFNANGKTYLCFEEGSDAQYSDMIVELGGTATSKITKQDASESGIENVEEFIESTDGCGFYSFDSEPEVQGIAYTMCFEDRPREADFDMNDVVIQARIIDSNTVQVILVACGAKDRLILQIPGSRLFNNTEIHNLFGLSGNQYYANTQINGLQINYGIFENINTELSLEEFLKTISLKNLDMDDIISFQKQGEYPRAIIVPSPFDYPQEKTSIMDAYPGFLEWVQNMNVNGNWYVMDRDAEKIFPNLFKKK